MKIRESELRGLVRESIKRVLKENKNKYVNMDVELPSSGRTGVKITPTEFTEHVEKVAIEVEYEANGKIKWKDIVNIIRNQCWRIELPRTKQYGRWQLSFLLSQRCSNIF